MTHTKQHQMLLKRTKLVQNDDYEDEKENNKYK